LPDATGLELIAQRVRESVGDAAVADTVERLLTTPRLGPKSTYRDTPVYNAGVEAQVTKDAAALLTERFFEIFARAAREHIPAGLPL
jgi:hydroxymethyl cephem carbamoyltransferase